MSNKDLLIPLIELDYYVHQYLDSRLRLIEISLTLDATIGLQSASNHASIHSAHNQIPSISNSTLELENYEKFYNSMLSVLGSFLSKNYGSIPMDNLLKLKVDLVQFIEMFYFGNMSFSLSQSIEFHTCSAHPTSESKLNNWCCSEFHRICLERSFELFYSKIVTTCKDQVSISILTLLTDFQVQIALIIGSLKGKEALHQYLNQCHQKNLVEKVSENILTSVDQESQAIKKRAKQYELSRFDLLQTIKTKSKISEFCSRFPLISLELSIFQLLKSMNVLLESSLFHSIEDFLSLHGAGSSVSKTWTMNELLTSMKQDQVSLEMMNNDESDEDYELDLPLEQYQASASLYTQPQDIYDKENEYEADKRTSELMNRHDTAERITEWSGDEDQSSYLIVKKRKMRKNGPFSEVEVKNLIEGYKRFGTKWAAILSTYSFAQDRTSVDLKDKARHLRSKGMLK